MLPSLHLDYYISRIVSTLSVLGLCPSMKSSKACTSYGYFSEAVVASTYFTEPTVVFAVDNQRQKTTTICKLRNRKKGNLFNEE
jgi:uncharacterized membrane protein